MLCLILGCEHFLTSLCIMRKCLHEAAQNKAAVGAECEIFMSRSLQLLSAFIRQLDQMHGCQQLQPWGCIMDGPACLDNEYMNICNTPHSGHMYMNIWK